ncbi:hypothetical protein AB0I77_29540 [Streptomyces sp. NPDC050619]|uniref:hypothetical protein n=1 Tax=Streptomyces sp. NPDC050619 TaxID=3157214 RepID=UPI00341E2651
MTPNEIQMLLVGLALGVQGMVVTHMLWDMRDARRSEAASRRIRRITAADQYMSSFRLYRLQHRSRA